MLALGAVELTKFLLDPAHEQGFNSTWFIHFWKRKQREEFNMSDLGEAPVSSRGGGGGGLCRRYVPTERHGFQAVCSGIGYKES